MARTDTRRRMITTAAKLMQRQGYHGTGLNQILAEAQAPKGSLYFHFPGGKDQLAAAAIAASADYVVGVLERHDAAPTADAVDAYIAGVAESLEQRDFATGCPIATVALEVGPAGGEIGEACASAFERLIAHIAGWLERDGLMPDEAADRAFLIYAAIEGAITFAKAQRSTEPLDRLRRRLPDLLPAKAARRTKSAKPRSRSRSAGR